MVHGWQSLQDGCHIQFELSTQHDFVRVLRQRKAEDLAAVEEIHDAIVEQKDRQSGFLESEQRFTKSCFPFLKHNGSQRCAMKGIKWIVDVKKKQVLEVTYLVDEEVSTKCFEKKLRKLISNVSIHD